MPSRSTWTGYRRDATGTLAPWPVEADGSLWSAVLGLRLLVDGGLLLARTADGEPLRLPEQEAAARVDEAHARQEAEAENQRLRRELDRLKRERG